MEETLAFIQRQLPRSRSLDGLPGPCPRPFRRWFSQPSRIEIPRYHLPLALLASHKVTIILQPFLRTKKTLLHVRHVICTFGIRYASKTVNMLEAWHGRNSARSRWTPYFRPFASARLSTTQAHGGFPRAHKIISRMARIVGRGLQWASHIPTLAMVSVRAPGSYAMTRNDNAWRDCSGKKDTQYSIFLL